MPDRYSLPKAIGWSIAFVVLTLLLAGLLAFGIAMLIVGSRTGATAWLESTGPGPILLQSLVTLGAKEMQEHLLSRLYEYSGTDDINDDFTTMIVRFL
jgi:hypothetical protein